MLLDLRVQARDKSIRGVILSFKSKTKILAILREQMICTYIQTIPPPYIAISTQFFEHIYMWIYCKH